MEIEVVKDTITYNGDFEGSTKIEVEEGMGLIMLSDVIPTLEDWSKGYIVTSSDGYEWDEWEGMSQEEILENLQYIMDDMGCLALGDGMIFVIPTDNFDLMGMITIPKAGIYTMYEGGFVAITSIHIKEYEGFNSVTEINTPIDLKYLPKSHQYGQDTFVYTHYQKELTWDGSTVGLEFVEYNGEKWYKVFSDPIAIGNISSIGYMAWGGTNNNGYYTAQFEHIYNGSFSFANNYIMSIVYDCTINNIRFSQGLYFKLDSNGECCRLIRSPKGFYSGTIVTSKPIDEAYIPDSVATQAQLDMLTEYVFRNSNNSGGSGIDTDTVQTMINKSLNNSDTTTMQTMINNAIFGAMEERY